MLASISLYQVDPIGKKKEDGSYMNKIFLLIIFVILIVISFTMFYNGFSKIEEITIQKYDEVFEYGKTTSDKRTIAAVTGILNRANDLNETYKLAGKPTYKIQLIYKDKSVEVIDIYENFDKNATLLSSDKNGYNKISDNQTQKLFELLLNKKGFNSKRYGVVKTNNKSIVSLTLGILSIIVPYIGILLAIIGIFISFKSIIEIERSNERGRGLAIAGRVCSIVGICFQRLLIMLLLFSISVYFMID